MRTHRLFSVSSRIVEGVTKSCQQALKRNKISETLLYSSLAQAFWLIRLPVYQEKQEYNLRYLMGSSINWQLHGKNELSPVHSIIDHWNKVHVNLGLAHKSLLVGTRRQQQVTWGTQEIRRGPHLDFLIKLHKSEIDFSLKVNKRKYVYDMKTSSKDVPIFEFVLSRKVLFDI